MTLGAFSPILIEPDVFKVAKVTGSLGNFEFFGVGLVLVTGGAVYILALDLVFLFQMRFVHKKHLLGKFYLFGLEFVIRSAVAVGGHTVGIADPRSGSDGLAAKLNVGEAFRRILGNVSTHDLRV